MNIFLAAIAGSGAIDARPLVSALDDLVGEVPFLRGSRVHEWVTPDRTAAVISLTNDPAQAGGVSYVHCSPEGFAAFSGRPVVRVGGGRIDGRAPLDPRFYLAPPEQWAPHLDGRFVAVSYSSARATLAAFSDPLGAYPLFKGEAHGMKVVSNNVAALCLLNRSWSIDEDALADFLSYGWSLSGQPMWREARRLTPGVLNSYLPGPGAAETRTVWSPAIARDYFEAGLDVPNAAATLVDHLTALADWPGRPSTVPLSGGRDSRLIFAAALRSDVDFYVRTAAIPGLVGFPETEDVRYSRMLCERVDVPHKIEFPSEISGPLIDVERAARVVRFMSQGTVSLADVATLRLERYEEPLELVHTGQGGELGRAYYGIDPRADDQTVARLFEKTFIPAYPRSLATRETRAHARQRLSGFVAEQRTLGFSTEQLPDMLYLLLRMGTWAGAVQGVHEWNGEATSPLWSTSLLPYEFALPTGVRAKEHFHLLMLQELAPELIPVPFESGNPDWPCFGADRRWSARFTMPPAAKRLRSVAKKANREFVQRRVLAHRQSEGHSEATRAFAELIRIVEEAALSQADHPAWEMMDKRRVQALLSRSPVSLDNRSQQYVWRLATVFLGS